MAPIVYDGPTRHFEVTKALEPLTAGDASALWGGLGVRAVLEAEGDVLGEAVARLLPPLMVLGSPSMFALNGIGQSFVGSRLSADKRSFTPLGEMHGNA
eukprot:gene49549-45709_t